jgi:hypothetical protein
VSDQQIFWHRELPPLDAEPMGEHVLEATSHRIEGTLAHRDEQWGACYETLMAQAGERLRQEITRLGGDYAHVLTETIDARHNDATREAWLHGRFDYVLFRKASSTPSPPSALPAPVRS